MSMIHNNVVLICDRVENRDGINIFTDTLEFTSPTYFNAISKSLEELVPKVYYYNSPEEFINNIQAHKNDIVISAIWSGVKSRNRKALIASICEAYNIKYIGADTYVQALCQDKQLSKYFCLDTDICVPKGIVISNMSEVYKLKNLEFPVVIKPNLEGSSIGISDNNIADSYEDTLPIIELIINEHAPILVEEYIPGVEVAACCVGTNNKMDLFEIVKLNLDGDDYQNHRIWGYESKKGGNCIVTRDVITSKVDDSIKTAIKKLYWSLGKVDYMRIDGRIYNNHFYLIELTPDCSLHPDCFMMAAFKHNEMTYTDMIEMLLHTAITDDK